MGLSRRVVVVILGLLVALAVGVGAYLWFVAPAEVAVVPVQTRDIVEVVNTSGKLRARTTRELGVGLPGVVGVVAAEEGAKVEQGELLVALRSPDLLVGVEQAQEELAEARAELDTARVRLQPGSAAFERAQQRFDEANSALALARAQFELSTVRAPFAGLVTEVASEPGQSVTADQPLVTLASLEDAEYVVEVDEDTAKQIELGQPAEVRFPAMPESGYEATVRQFVLAADSERGVVDVHLEPKRLPPNATPGLSVDVDIVVFRLENAPSVPRASLLEHGAGRASVLVVDDGRAARRAVVVIATDDDYAAVGGIPRGTLVIENAAAIVPGTRVEAAVRKPTPPPAGDAGAGDQ